MFFNDRDLGLQKAPRLKIPRDVGAANGSDSSSSYSSDDGEGDPNSSDDYRARRRAKEHKKKLQDVKYRPRQDQRVTEFDLLDPDTATFTDRHYMLLARHVYAFLLKDRKWGMFRNPIRSFPLSGEADQANGASLSGSLSELVRIDNLREPEFRDDMIDALVLQDEAKNLVQALSNTQAHHVDEASPDHDPSTLPGRFSADFVRNKGEGRIFLLHGRPGVGKTTTAECVAEQTRSPLLAITSGDLGTEAREVEKNLSHWMKLASLWKAVLLLDEADVYLESRTPGDLYRNGLVSIFLRALEYYQGLLFLTTNRIGTFDEALLSRIHVVLHYPEFDDRQRRQIWRTSFRKLAEERPDVHVAPDVRDYAESHADVLALHWNGREIRNAFNTVVALAEFDAERKRLRAAMAGPRAGKRPEIKVTLERDHLEQVVRMSANFKQYMKQTRGMDEAKYAKVYKLRADDLVLRL